MNEGADAPLLDPSLFVNLILLRMSTIGFEQTRWLVCHPSKNGPWSSLVGGAKDILEGFVAPSEPFG